MNKGLKAFAVISVASLMAAAVGCGGKSSAQEVLVGGQTYKVATSNVTGASMVTPQSAQIWRNGQPTTLDDGSQRAIMAGSAMDGDDDYAAYQITTLSDSSSSPSTVIYTQTSSVWIWKNGVASQLDVGANAQASAVRMTAKDGDVYVVGYLENMQTFEGSHVYWKNGVATKLAQASNEMMVAPSAIAVAGGNAYICGESFTGATSQVNGRTVITMDKPRATVWKNGVESYLEPNGVNSVCNGVAVGDGVIAVGVVYDENKGAMAMLWKNGVATALTDGSTASLAYGVSYASGHIYVAGVELGSDKKSHAVLWLDGEKIKLEDADQYPSMAYKVTVHDGDVYVLGSIDKGSTTYAQMAYWKNGKLTTVTDGSTYVIGTSISVR